MTGTADDRTSVPAVVLPFDEEHVYWRPLVSGAVGLIATAYLMRQVRKPSQWIGHPFLWLMNQTHSSLTDWGLHHVVIETDFAILDVGCGGGATVKRLAALATNGTVCGIDYANGSVAMSRRTNAALIAHGRVDIRKAPVSELPFADGRFDLVTAIETHYYWPDLDAGMREIRRVLKPSGTLVMIAESYAGGRFDPAQRVVMKPLKSAHLSVDEHRELFTKAGYEDIRIFENRGRGWICALGRAPAVGNRESGIGNRESGIGVGNRESIAVSVADQRRALTPCASRHTV